MKRFSLIAVSFIFTAVFSISAFGQVPAATATGKIGLLTIGMSNTRQESQSWGTLIAQDPQVIAVRTESKFRLYCGMLSSTGKFTSQSCLNLNPPSACRLTTPSQPIVRRMLRPSTCSTPRTSRRRKKPSTASIS